jgi:predicted Fe-Mo cluster-binding NifX family protein
MKVAISVTAARLDAELDPRFGRAAAFVIVDTDTSEWQGHLNPGANAPGGAGTQAASFVARQGAEAAISGAFGPNAYDVLSAANVKMYRAVSGTAAEIVQKFKDGDLDLITSASRGGRGGGRGGWR